MKDNITPLFKIQEEETREVEQAQKVMQEEAVKPKWETEPDFKLIHEGNGFHVFVFRNMQMGNLNGYVGVDRTHPWFAETMDGKASNLRVHGGITFASKGGWHEHFKKKYWYFGFDTAHFMDLVPAMDAMRRNVTFAFDSFMQHGEYRDMEYVTDEVNSLLVQLEAIKERNKGYKHSFVREYRKLSREKKRKQNLHSSFAK
ncbi:hypothetical protein [Bacillus wiedmannii]|uniref:hypothetical protein n=1 Tax=Bacillus wiedmannii TaxID=1890302 RepID=UPI003D24D476